MRVSTRRRLTFAEQLLGTRRARRLRRRLGLVVLGTGLLLLRPRRGLPPVLVAMVLAAAAGGAVLVIR